MTVWVDRSVHLGVGANIKLGGSVKFNVAETEDAPATFEKTLVKVLGIVDRFCEQIEANASLPENWPDKAAPQGA